MFLGSVLQLQRIQDIFTLYQLSLKTRLERSLVEAHVDSRRWGFFGGWRTFAESGDSIEPKLGALGLFWFARAWLKPKADQLLGIQTPRPTSGARDP